MMSVRDFVTEKPAEKRYSVVTGAKEEFHEIRE